MSHGARAIPEVRQVELSASVLSRLREAADVDDTRVASAGGREASKSLSLLPPLLRRESLVMFGGRQRSQPSPKHPGDAVPPFGFFGVLPSKSRKLKSIYARVYLLNTASCSACSSMKHSRLYSTHYGPYTAGDSMRRCHGFTCFLTGVLSHLLEIALCLF